jgi:hypothetical protein
MIDVLGATHPREEAAPTTVRFPAVSPPPAVLVVAAPGPAVSPRPPVAGPSPLAASLPFPQTRTAPMAARPPADAGTIEVFPGERLSNLDDFVRLALASRRITFLSVLDREGISPQYYTEMTRRLDALVREVPALGEELELRMRLAEGRAA